MRDRSVLPMEERGGLRSLLALCIVSTCWASSASAPIYAVGASVDLICPYASAPGQLRWTLTQASPSQNIITTGSASSTYACAGPFLSPQTQKCRDEITFDASNATQFKIRPVLFTDAGRYTCVVQLSNGTALQQDILVTVIESTSPRLTIATSATGSKLEPSPKPIPVQPGTTLNITCSLSFSGFLNLSRGLCLYRHVANENNCPIEATPYSGTSQSFTSSSTVVASSQHRVAENESALSFQCRLFDLAPETAATMSFQVTEKPGDDDKRRDVIVTAVVTTVVLVSVAVFVLVLIVCCVKRKRQGNYSINRGTMTTAATTPWQTGKGVSATTTTTTTTTKPNRAGANGPQQYTNPAFSLDK